MESESQEKTDNHGEIGYEDQTASNGETGSRRDINSVE